MSHFHIFHEDSESLAWFDPITGRECRGPLEDRGEIIQMVRCHQSLRFDRRKTGDTYIPAPIDTGLVGNIATDPIKRRCKECSIPLPPNTRSDAAFCSLACKQTNYRSRKEDEASAKAFKVKQNEAFLNRFLASPERKILANSFQKTIDLEEAHLARLGLRYNGDEPGDFTHPSQRYG